MTDCNETKGLLQHTIWMWSVWLRSGPGFYAGINIALNGEWPSVVLKHASTC